MRTDRDRGRVILFRLANRVLIVIALLCLEALGQAAGPWLEHISQVDACLVGLVRRRARWGGLLLRQALERQSLVLAGSLVDSVRRVEQTEQLFGGGLLEDCFALRVRDGDLALLGNLLATVGVVVIVRLPLRKALFVRAQEEGTLPLARSAR